MEQCKKRTSQTFKVGLSNADKLAMEETIYNRVVGQIEDITISGVRPNIQALIDEFPNGTGGIWITEDNGNWNYYDIVLKEWKAGGLFTDEEVLNNLQNNKVDKDMLDWGTMPTEITNRNLFYKEVSKVFATSTQSIYMFGTPEELDRFWGIWTKPIGLKATHVYIAIKPLSNKSSRYSFIMWVFASNYATPYFRVVNGYNGQYVSAEDKGWVDVNKLATISEEILKGNKKVLATDYQGGLISLDYDVLPNPTTMVLRQVDGTIQSAMPKEDTDVATKKYVDSKASGVDAYTLDTLIDNTYPDEITKEVNQDSLLEIHLDRHFVSSLDQEQTLAVMRPSASKQQWTLGGEEVARLKGLRVWIKFAYNGNTLVLSHDIRFPTNRSGYQWFVSTPIPNPAIFSEKIIVQYDTSNDVLSLSTTGGSISADTQIIEVKGIK